MQNFFDVIIIGGGPAGLSAATTLRARDKSVAIISNEPTSSALFKSEHVSNYLGFVSVTGGGLLEQMLSHVEQCGATIITGRVLSVMPSGDGFLVSYGSDFLQCSALIFAFGVLQRDVFDGESELLGKGVSYCATCDGMLYKGKNVAVVGLSEDAEREADFLRSIGCKIEYFDRKRAKKYAIKGKDRVEALIADGVEYPLDGVFILRDTVSVSSLLPGLEISDGSIAVNRKMAASIPGVFAAGDCVGKPFQVAKSVGEGNIAALSAIEYLGPVLIG